MSATSYSVYLNNPQGVRLAVLPFLRLDYTLSLANVGSLTVDIPPTAIPASFYGRDFQLEVWRSVSGGAEYLEGDKKWLVRKVTKTYGDQNTLTLSAECCNTILGRRIVAYDADTSYTAKAGDDPDDTMKAIVRENFTSGIVGASRDVTGSADISFIFGVQNDLNIGNSISVSCARENVLETLRKICEASITAGVYVAFDVVWTGFRYEFRTYRSQRGVDHRYPSGLNPVILGQEFGNLTDVQVVEDFSSEATVVIAGAQGIGTQRTIATATDTVRVAASPLGHIEVFEQANTAGFDSTTTTDRADARLRAGRPVRLITGRISETAATQYGREWGWGDRVTVQVEGVMNDARVDAVSVSVSGGAETIDAGVRIDD